MGTNFGFMRPCDQHWPVNIRNRDFGGKVASSQLHLMQAHDCGTCARKFCPNPTSEPPNEPGIDEALIFFNKDVKDGSFFGV